MEQEILLLGNEALYKPARKVVQRDKEILPATVQNLHDTLMAYRARYGAGRAIAAPQIGVPLRLIYMNIADKATVFVNPNLEFAGDEKMEVLDDCMSFPGLYVKVMRYKRCTVHFQNESFQLQTLHFEGDLAELIQHEFDHLDGILATQRAINEKAFVMKKM